MSSARSSSPFDLSVRPGRLDDAFALPAVERSAGALFATIPELAWIADDHVEDVASHRDHIDAGLEWVVVDHADRPVGFVMAAVEGDALHIDEVCVADGFQRRGAGRALMAAAVEAARARGLAAVTLTTFRDVPWNGPFYARLGFDTLAPADLDPRLAAILKAEGRRGMPMERRIAMRLAVCDER